jgi:hypothetical protein
VALSISLISLLITGLDVSATAQVAYARAFTMAPLRGIQKYLRGAAWLILLLAGTGAVLTLRSVAASHPLWVAIVAGAVLVALQFGFFLVSPRLLLSLPFAWRDLIPGAAVCTGAAIVVHAVSALFLRNWFGVYGHAYGGFGISLALAAFVGIIASFWVWIAAVMGVWWERGRGQQRRGEQPDGEPDRAQAGCALADHVVGLFHRQVAFEVLADDHRAVQVAAAGQDRLVVVLGGVLRQVAADQHIDRLVIEFHRSPLRAAGLSYCESPCAAWPWWAAACSSSSSWAERCGFTSNMTFLTVPVNANGFLSS